MSRKAALAEVASWGLNLGEPDSVSVTWGPTVTITRATWGVELGELIVEKYAGGKTSYFEAKVVLAHPLRMGAAADSAKGAVIKSLRLAAQGAEFLAENVTTITNELEGEA